VAIVAHPYAPMGGCYDDPVVGRIASTMLDDGFIVGTFNFRYVLSFIPPWISYMLSRWCTEELAILKDEHRGNQNQSKTTI
jgi:hypothetical protein